MWLDIVGTLLGHRFLGKISQRGIGVFLSLFFSASFFRAFCYYLEIKDFSPKGGETWQSKRK